MKKSFLSLLLLFCIHSFASAQCGVTINTFPYFESFEQNTGNWASGGVFNDWAWGAPNKPIIQSAGDGAKCWIVGGLSGAAYNFDERSYLLSPCFDFTNVPFPHIKFKIYWETENPYDGATLQYTTNNGATWTNVGAANDPMDCLNSNWFNQTNVNALNTLAVPKHGWAGTSLPTVGNCIGGAGSMGWVTAQHTLYNLAGLPSVQFRFAFGAGSVCNSFDGVAIDAVSIQNIPPLTWVAVAPNNISCNGGNTGGINALAIGGTGPYTYHLDPVNLTNNNGTFNSLVVGSYTVSATDANGCSINSVVALSQPLPIVFVSINSNNLNCFGDASGSVSVSYNGGIGGLTYTLYPNGTTNANGVFNGLNGGNYTIVATDATGCTQSTTSSSVNRLKL
ncbi:MAG: SprB repeat-containing protein [Bacteroidetes bacterium]|nr:SprB repeat-containing protein [Bacteroidota bacterium]